MVLPIWSGIGKVDSRSYRSAWSSEFNSRNLGGQWVTSICDYGLQWAIVSILTFSRSLLISPRAVVSNCKYVNAQHRFLTLGDINIFIIIVYKIKIWRDNFLRNFHCLFRNFLLIHLKSEGASRNYRACPYAIVPTPRSRREGWNSANGKSGLGTCALAFRDRPSRNGKTESCFCREESGSRRVAGGKWRRVLSDSVANRREVGVTGDSFFCEVANSAATSADCFATGN